MIAIFTYHSVAPGDYLYGVSPEAFEKQLTYLVRHCHVISLRELAGRLQSAEEPPRRTALITFDDGVEDNYLYAFPVLQRLALPATIFLTTSLVGKVHANPHYGEIFPFLNWDEIHEMAQSGLVEFGNHTHTHPLLTDLSEAELRKEIETAQALLKEHVGREPYAFSYPKGKADERVKSIVKDYFSLAIAEGGGVVPELRNADHLSLPRINVTREIPLWKFRAMTRHSFWQLKKLRKNVLP